jgi:DNA-binding ferritin-like protein
MNLISTFLTMQNQLKVFHWQTRSHAAHQAFGEAYKEMDELIDEFIEIYQGKRGRIMARDHFAMKLSNIPDKPETTLASYCEWLCGPLTENLDSHSDTDLMNLRDEMKAVLNKTRYLLTLK